MRLLVVGAGPYGLAVAAYAQSCGLETVLLGRPMDFWRERMPTGMFLRSGLDWHLDATEQRTLRAYAQRRGLTQEALDPLPIEFFLEYAQWFQEGYGLLPRPERLALLERDGDGFCARLDSGEALRATHVVVAAGFAPFRNLDHCLAGQPGVYHSADLTRFEQARGKRFLIVGGRQSAFEWAALLMESGAARVDVAYRHATPRFERSDWTWTDAMIGATVATEGWFSSLTELERQTIVKRFWQVGRLKLEPWLASRLARPGIHLWPGTRVEERSGKVIRLQGESKEVTLESDEVVLATGYRMDLARLEYLEPLKDKIACRGGFPELSSRFESTIPGLFFTSYASTQAFGPFFGFLRGCTTTARLLVDHLR